ncbi:hypothetical protein [Cellulomonas uda]|uniref:Uncharacterized protein n=1 Tax=Cellulomonas uda TaxID=1714 RepID=A0A4Y3K8A7_CELUD|nr:hypothetical protein [Cellulomonas uda]NII67797.1 hypothetical protein [Cellulomonas uda]GEA79956.1 hypothetical protein CUD01_04000 [Cellulomonas uda]
MSTPTAKRTGLVRVQLDTPCLRCGSTDTYGARWHDDDGALIRQVATGCHACGWSSSRYNETHPYGAALAPDPSDADGALPDGSPADALLRFTAVTGLELVALLDVATPDLLAAGSGYPDADVRAAALGHWLALVAATRACYDTHALLSRLRELDPTAADDMAESLRLAAEYSLHGEGFTEWVAAHGIDVDHVFDDAKRASQDSPPALLRVLGEYSRLRARHPAGPLPTPQATPADDEDPATTEAIDTIARHVVATHGPLETGSAWEDYPEIGEHDWSRVCAAAAAVREDLWPEHDRYDAAYGLLAARAVEV